MLLIGLIVTLTPIAGAFGFVHPPLIFLGIIALITITYLLCVQLLKAWFVKKYGYE